MRIALGILDELSTNLEVELTYKPLTLLHSISQNGLIYLRINLPFSQTSIHFS